MSEPSNEQLEHEAKEKFVNDFWDSITVDLKYEILQAKYGKDWFDTEYQDWLSEQDHE